MLFTCYVATMPRLQCSNSNCNYIASFQSLFSTSYDNPDDIPAEEGSNMGTDIIMASGNWGYTPTLCLRPLGDTTVTIWDDD